MAGSSVKRLDDPNYMQTAGRALDILALLEDGPSLSLSELSKRTGLSPSVTYRLLYTLGEHGFVKQHPGSKDYSIGDKAVMLGLTGLQEKRIMRAARKLIGEWWLQTGHIITVLCLIDKKAVVVYRINPMPDEAEIMRRHQEIYLQQFGQEKYDRYIQIPLRPGEAILPVTDWTE